MTNPHIDSTDFDLIKERWRDLEHAIVEEKPLSAPRKIYFGFSVIWSLYPTGYAIWLFKNTPYSTSPSYGFMASLLSENMLALVLLAVGVLCFIITFVGWAKKSLNYPVAIAVIMAVCFFGLTGLFFGGNARSTGIYNYAYFGFFNILSGVHMLLMKD